MCEYCKDGKPLMTKKIIAENMIWLVSTRDSVVDLNDDAFWTIIGVVIDNRGYIRLVDMDDYSCLDHGEKIRIEQCPMCGRELKE